MSRIIKFRAFVNNKMEFFDLLQSDNSHVDYVDIDKVMQFSGFLDDKKTQIYEGDILFCENRKVKKYCEVYFANGCFKCEYQTLYEFLQWNICTVVGNIYENKQLLNN